MREAELIRDEEMGKVQVQGRSDQHATYVATPCMTSHPCHCACSLYSASQAVTYMWHLLVQLACDEAASLCQSAPGPSRTTAQGALEAARILSGTGSRAL